MEFYTDFKDFIKLLNHYGVKYLLVGGYALSFYSRPKSTQDIDIFIEASIDNAKKVLYAINEFGLSSLNISLKDLTAKDRVIQMGVPPIRIDIMTSIEGIDFDEAYKNRKVSEYGDIENVSFISINDFKKNKKNVGRKKDLDDLKWLSKYRAKN